MLSHKAASCLLTLVVFSSVLITGEVFASPDSYSEQGRTNERIEYADSLNSIASTLMNWYGSLITTNHRQAGKARTNIAKMKFPTRFQSWQEYRATYPENITGIKITSADLNKQDSPGQYTFEIEVLMTHMQSNKSEKKLIKESFLFQMSYSRTPEIIQVSNLSSTANENLDDSSQTMLNDTHYYKSRKFAYGWLAYMGGMNVMGSQINIENWIDKANYSVKIGGFELNEKVASSLHKRNQHLGKGGHLLRSIASKTIDGLNNHYELDIIIDWKGTDPGGTPAIAKINQVIQYKLQEDGSLIVLSIKEKHLLPDLEPWQNILC